MAIKKISVESSLSWIFGILFALTGIVFVFSAPIPGLVMLIMAGVLLPPVIKFIDQKWKVYLSKGIKIIIIIIGLIVFGATIDTSNVSNIQQAESQKEEQRVIQNKEERKKTAITELGNEEQPKNETNEQIVNEEKTETVLTTDAFSAIKKAINTTGDYEVTIWTMDDNFAKTESTPPFEIIVNTSASQIQNCFDAKNKLFNVMKAVYDNSAIKGDVSRIKFTAWGQLKASLGSQDIGFDWSTSGPSNFWKALQQYKSYEDESGVLNQRTYGVRINSNCE